MFHPGLSHFATAAIRPMEQKNNKHILFISNANYTLREENDCGRTSAE